MKINPQFLQTLKELSAYEEDKQIGNEEESEDRGINDNGGGVNLSENPSEEKQESENHAFSENSLRGLDTGEVQDQIPSSSD